MGDEERYQALADEMSRPDPDPEVARFEVGQPAPDLQRQPEPEPQQQRHAEPSPQQDHSEQQAYQQPPQQQHQQHNFPSAEDDPIGHFSARTERMENFVGQMHAQAQEKQFWDNLSAH